MLNLNIDSKRKKIDMEIKLLGENETVKVNVGRYKLVHEGGKYFIEVKDISVSKKWMEVIAKNYVEGRKIPVSDKVAKTLNLVI